MAALAVSVLSPPAEARDVLILRSEVRRGELVSCDASACRLDGSSIPRRDIVWIGLGDPPLPVPTIQNPVQDELHLRDGSVRPGPLVNLNARQVVTPVRTYVRREVRWIYLPQPPASSTGRGRGAAEDSSGGEGRTCGFWLGTVGRREVFRNEPGGVTRTTRTVYTVLWREEPRSGDVGLHLDDASVRERLREVVSDSSGGNRTSGSGTSHIDGAISDGLIVRRVPSSPSSYKFNVGTDKHRYPSTTHWPSAPPTHRQELFTGIWVGLDPDPEQPRILDASGRTMKGEYAVTHDYGAGSSLTESVSWELTRAETPCKAPPGLPSVPAETDEPNDAEP